MTCYHPEDFSSYPQSPELCNSAGFPWEEVENSLESLQTFDYTDSSSSWNSAFSSPVKPCRLWSDEQVESLTTDVTLAKKPEEEAKTILPTEKPQSPLPSDDESDYEPVMYQRKQIALADACQPMLEYQTGFELDYASDESMTDDDDSMENDDSMDDSDDEYQVAPTPTPVARRVNARASSSKVPNAMPTDDKLEKYLKQDLRKDGKPKRPMNSFIIYRRVRNAQIKEQKGNTSTGHVSGTVGDEWKRMSEAEKAPWAALEKRIKAQHEAEFPDYKYERKVAGSKKAAATLVPKTSTRNKPEPAPKKRAKSAKKSKF